MQTTDDKGVLYLDSEAVAGDIFIPHAFAMEKLKNATSQYLDMKMSYDRHILELKSSHDSHCQQTQQFYEGYIKEVKRKAKQHVEGQSALKQDMLDDSRQKVADSEEVVERLRDQLTNLRLTYQEDSRSLKQQLSLANENETVLQTRVYDASVRSECAAVISDLVMQAEFIFMRQNFDDKMAIASGKTLSLSISGDKTAKANNEEKSRIQTEMKTDRECRATMQAMLLRIEIDAHNQQVARDDHDRSAGEKLRDKCQAAEMSILSLTADSVAAKSELSNLQIASDKSAAVFSAIISQHESFQSNLQNDHEVAMTALNKELNKLSVALIAADLSVQSTTAASLDAEKLRDSLDRALVRELLSNMVADVSDRQLCQINLILATERADHKKDMTANDCTISDLQHQLKVLSQHAEIKAETCEQRNRGTGIASNGVSASALVVKSEAVSAVHPLDNKPSFGTASESQDAVALRLKLSQVEKRLLDEKQTVSLLEGQKTKSKSIITKWVAQFEVDNKRPPIDADKEMVRDKYQTYKSDTRTLKCSVAVVDSLQKEKAEIEEHLLLLNTNSDGNMILTTGSPCADKAAGDSSVSSTVPVTSMKQSSSGSVQSERGSRGEDMIVIEGLEDTVYQLQQDISHSAATASKVAEENAILAQQLDLITREKRTDIVKRFEQEIISLTAQTSHLKESLIQLEAVKAKNTA